MTPDSTPEHAERQSEEPSDESIAEEQETADQESAEHESTDQAVEQLDVSAVALGGPLAEPGTVEELEEEREEPKRQTSQKQQEDRLLVQRARSGDQLAYHELVKRHRHGVERLIRPMVRSASSDELEDLVQEALTKAMLHLNSYSDEYAFSTWLYRIATNHAIDYLRRKKLNAFSISAPPSITTHKSEDESREFEISDSSWVPDEVMMADERTALIEEAIDQLPENYKRIIRLRHNDDMEYEEIARVLNLPMGTVKVHLHRARAALARILEGRI